MNVHSAHNRDNRPYRLGYDVRLGLVCAQGPLRVTRLLRQVRGAAVVGDLARDGFLTLPDERATHFACEAAGVPDEVSGPYRRARAYHFAVDVGPTERGLAQLLRRPLLPHQLQFAAWAYTRRGVLNASEQGTGKTAAVLALLALWAPRRTVVVCPKSLAPEWVREWGELFYHRPPFFVHDLTFESKAERIRYLREELPCDPDPAVILVNYEVLSDLLTPLRGWGPQALVCDESWRVKNRQAEVTRAALRLAASVRRVALLTGTPVGNDVGDLWSQLACLHDPEDTGELESYWQFLGRYATLAEVRLGTRTVQKPVGVSDLPALLRRLEPHWFRVTKACCFELPPKRYERVVLPPTDEQAALYRALLERGEAALGDPLALTNPAVLTLRLQQVAGGFHPPAALSADDVERDWSDWTATDLLPLPCRKVDWLQEFARDRLLGEPTVRALVWCRFNSEVARCAQVLTEVLGEGRVATATGATREAELEAYKASLNSRDPDGVQVLVAQVKKLAYGHNLQAVDHAVYYSNSWSYVERSQSEDRNHRLGREGGVTYWDLLTEGTVDEAVLAALERKEDFAGTVTPLTAPSVAGEEVVVT